MKVILKQYNNSLSLEINRSCIYMDGFFEVEDFKPTYNRTLLKYLEQLKIEIFQLVLYLKDQIIVINGVPLRTLIERYIEWNKKKTKQFDTFEIFISEILQLKIK